MVRYLIRNRCWMTSVWWQGSATPEPQTASESTDVRLSILKYIICLIGLAGAITIPAGAQTLPDERMTYDFRGESLERVLDRIARDTGIDLVYDPELVRGRDVFKRINDRPVSDMLRMILI